MAEQRRTRRVGRIEDGGEIVGKIGHTEPPPIAGRRCTAMATVVPMDESVVCRQLGYQVLPDVPVTPDAVAERKRRPVLVAEDPIIDRRAVDGDGVAFTTHGERLLRLVP